MSAAGVLALSDVDPELVEWLWAGRVPRGKLVVVDGDPSTGKSTLMLDWAARVSTGRTWPDGAHCERGSVLIMSAEDGIADTIRPRLDAAGADPTRVFALVDVATTDEEGQERRVPPSLPRDIGILHGIIADLGVRLVVVDVLMAYLAARVDSHRDQDVRGVLHQLAALADGTGCTIVLVRHLNKAGGSNVLYRGGGSIGIVGAARAAYLVARDPDDPDRRILACSKSNLAAEPPALAYRLVDTPSAGAARVQWEDGPVDHTAASLLRGGESDDRDDHHSVDRWLTELLEGGPLEATEVYRAADAAGYSKDQAKRAKARLRVDATHPRIPGPWYWSLTPREHQGSQESGVCEPAPLRPLGAPLGDDEDDDATCRACNFPLPAGVSGYHAQCRGGVA